MRVATEALPYENPKLSVVAVTSLTGKDFASALERASALSGVTLIEGKAVEPPGLNSDVPRF